eukprot:TRINITY_DN8489_c0_g1_i1.p2 TRINITY_DN8489_c0_g1~~TRINITY_DN8489_c0_g1_i1.p2  ORF type:complete len:372 (+),score=80.02 TRINITY_DN8489_c0_g1_i1:98-1213(+)
MAAGAVLPQRGRHGRLSPGITAPMPTESTAAVAQLCSMLAAAVRADPLLHLPPPVPRQQPDGCRLNLVAGAVGPRPVALPAVPGPAAPAPADGTGLRPGLTTRLVVVRRGTAKHVPGGFVGGINVACPPPPAVDARSPLSASPSAGSICATLLVVPPQVATVRRPSSAPFPAPGPAEAAQARRAQVLARHRMTPPPPPPLPNSELPCARRWVFRKPPPVPGGEQQSPAKARLPRRGPHRIPICMPCSPSPPRITADSGSEPSQRSPRPGPLLVPWDGGEPAAEEQRRQKKVARVPRCCPARGDPPLSARMLRGWCPPNDEDERLVPDICAAVRGLPPSPDAAGTPGAQHSPSMWDWRGRRPRSSRLRQHAQ